MDQVKKYGQEHKIIHFNNEQQERKYKRWLFRRTREMIENGEYISFGKGERIHKELLKGRLLQRRRMVTIQELDRMNLTKEDRFIKPIYGRTNDYHKRFYKRVDEIIFECDPYAQMRWKEEEKNSYLTKMIQKNLKKELFAQMRNKESFQKIAQDESDDSSEESFEEEKSLQQIQRGKSGIKLKDKRL